VVRLEFEAGEFVGSSAEASVCSSIRQESTRNRRSASPGATWTDIDPPGVSTTRLSRMA
jgi:hypothetical protein